MRGSSITLEDYAVEEVLRLFREAGFTSLEMWKHHLGRCKTNELRQKFVKHASELGIAMGGFNVVGEDYFQPFGTDSEMEQTLAGLKADMEFALSLGTRDVLVWEGRAPLGTSEADWLDRFCPRLIELFKAAISLAKPEGARFLVEPHPFTVGMSDRVLIKLCDSLDADCFGVTYDFCHYGVGRPNDYVQAIYALGPRIRNLHFSDSDMKSSELHFPPGSGRVNLAATLEALRSIRYRGTMALDLYGYPLPVHGLKTSIARLREATELLGLDG
jgi:sugar phosphate isomerase/epimerase